MNAIIPTLLILSSIVVLGGCNKSSGDGGGTAAPVLPNASTLTSVTISGTVNEPSTVVVNGVSDSDADPLAFSVIIPVTESATGADLNLEVTATDGDLNSSSEDIDLQIVK